MYVCLYVWHVYALCVYMYVSVYVYVCTCTNALCVGVCMSCMHVCCVYL